MRYVVKYNIQFGPLGVAMKFTFLFGQRLCFFAPPGHGINVFISIQPTHVLRCAFEVTTHTHSCQYTGTRGVAHVYSKCTQGIIPIISSRISHYHILWT